MSSHNTIVLSAAPKGTFIEGIVSGTPKPGTAMMIVAATEPVDGRHTWIAMNRAADGNRYLMAILLEDEQQGKLVTDAYVDGTRCRMYCPAPGEELQVLLENQDGTADSFAIGDLLMVDDGTGKFLATAGTPESEPFIVLETLAALTADALCHVMATGN